MFCQLAARRGKSHGDARYVEHLRVDDCLPVEIGGGRQRHGGCSTVVGDADRPRCGSQLDEVKAQPAAGFPTHERGVDTSAGKGGDDPAAQWIVRKDRRPCRPQPYTRGSVGDVGLRAGHLNIEGRRILDPIAGPHRKSEHGLAERDQLPFWQGLEVGQDGVNHPVTVVDERDEAPLVEGGAGV